MIDLAIISNSTTQQVGDNLLLVCMGHGQPRIDITWTKDGQVVSNDSYMFVSEDQMVVDGRIYTHSFLRLCNLQTCHSGMYNCTVDNGISSVESSLSLSVEG